jgi:hypothetical protein
MKKITLLFLLTYFSTSILFSQYVSGIVEYEITYWECKYCHLKGKAKDVLNILKVSDYKYLPQVYYTALNEKSEYGCVKDRYCSLSNNVNHWHSNIQTDMPTYEKKSFDRISKDLKFSEALNISYLEEVSKKINADFIKWKKLYDSEKIKKEQVEKQIAQENEEKRNVLMNEQRITNKPILDSLVNENKFYEAAQFLNKINGSVDRLVMQEFYNYRRDKFVSYLNGLLDKNMFQLFDTELQNQKASITNYEDFVLRRIYKENDLEINRIKLASISQDELLLIGDWSFVSLNGLIMRIILKQDKSFEFASNWKLELNSGGPYHNDWYKFYKVSNYGLKGYWRVKGENIELIVSEDYENSKWNKSKQKLKLFTITYHKKNKLIMTHQIPQHEKYNAVGNYNSEIFEFKGKRSIQK